MEPPANHWVHTVAEFRKADVLQNCEFSDDTLTLINSGNGIIVSVPIDAGSPVVWEHISWKASCPPGTSISARVRFANSHEGLSHARWSAVITRNPGKISVYGSPPMTPQLAAARFIQYKLELSGKKKPFPHLQKVELSWRPPQPSGYWPPDAAEAHPQELTLRWLEVPGVASYEVEIAHDIKFQTNLRKFRNITNCELQIPKDLSTIGKNLWWRVRAVHENQTRSAFSSVRLVTISNRRIEDRYPCTNHPRLFFNKSELAELKAKIKTDESVQQAFQNIKALADAALISTIPTEEEVASAPGQHGNFHNLVSQVARGQLEPLAFSFLITDDERYAQHARTIMLSLAAYTRWIGKPFGDTNYFNPTWSAALETAGICKGMATAYDWLYDYLSPTDREIIREAIIRLGIRPLIHDWADPETYSKIPRHQLPAGNWWAVCNSGAGIAALALLDETPEAHRWVRLVEDAIKWYLVYRGGDIWNIHLKANAGGEYFAYTEPNWGVDAGYAESIAYLHYGLLNAVYFIEALKRTTGKDISPFIRKDILDEALYGLFHDENNGWVMLNFNDSGLGDNLSADFYALAARHTRNAHIQWMLEETHHDSHTIHSILARDESLKPLSPAGLPKAKFFRDIGWAVFRTGWEKNSSLFAVKFRQGRGHEDLGQFVIYHCGQRHIVDPGAVNYANEIYQTFLNQTKAHNVVMVDGFRQQRVDGKNIQFAYSNGVGIAAADLTPAYQDLVNRWTRGVGFLAHGIYFVWDSLEAPEEHQYSWLIHPNNSFETNENTASFGESPSALEFTLLSTAHTKTETLPGYIGEREQPYLSFSIVGKNVGFLGIFHDKKFNQRQLNQNSLELTTADQKALITLGKFESSGKCPIQRFEGGALIAISTTSPETCDKLLAFQCRKLIAGKITISARRPVSFIMEKSNGNYIFHALGKEKISVSANKPVIQPKW